VIYHLQPPLLADPYAPPRAPHSFPTRRSSDLAVDRERRPVRQSPAGGQQLSFRSFPNQPPFRTGHFHGYCLARCDAIDPEEPPRSEEHTSELQSRENLVCRLLLEKKKDNTTNK